MKRTIRLFLLAEGITFAIAASIHFGALVAGYEHWEAAIAESLIATVLLVGCPMTLVFAAQTRPIGIATQAFALLGTLVGLFTIAIGVGPRTVPDVAYHVAIVAVLIAGLFIAARASAPGTTQGGMTP